MMDLNALMKQAQAMQQKLAEAQDKLNDVAVTGEAGAGLVSVELRGTGILAGLRIDPSLLTPDEGEVLIDLIVAAHADARKKLDEASSTLMKEAAGPFGNMPNMPKFF
ncbi:YbaB/EbfC family nucleoid-associated protein [Asticcacaulis sp. BYS171W]|uniref:Nucleoid-associated protein PQU92_15905 n=1 Tax=Asticcacaulis aquaticus TaxID=2984212 RepID=A0ABT5HY48_9CAUL|nr:YbaB/EbfC family nucleoid-associated protein [Asticcacaulis aquaticus]MDC7684770.1 YbaB/EbfC family nucleoid-associated protein [Asticcacaulis aquaticus]